MCNRCTPPHWDSFYAEFRAELPENFPHWASVTAWTRGLKQHSLDLGITATQTLRRGFPDEIERVVPWANLVALLSPYLPDCKRGRPPFSPETMLRRHFMQQRLSLSEPAMEAPLHDMPVFREFAGLEG